MEAWLSEVCRHPIISRSSLIEGFVTIQTEVGKKNENWKKFKREQEICSNLDFTAYVLERAVGKIVKLESFMLESSFQILVYTWKTV